MSISKGYLLIPLLLLLQSCASIVSKSTYPVAVRVDPEGADLSITNRRGREVFNGKAPTIVYLKAGGGYFVKQRYLMNLSKEGYKDRTLPITFSIDGWYFGNVLIGGLIGFLIIDPLTGAMWKIDTSYYDVILKELPPSTSPELRIIEPDDVPEEWRKWMTLIH